MSAPPSGHSSLEKLFNHLNDRSYRRRGRRRKNHKPTLMAEILGPYNPGGNPFGPVSSDTWCQIVGRRNGIRTEPCRLDNQTLFVRVSSSVWAQELSLLSADITEKLRALGIDVTSLRFFVGEVTKPEDTYTRWIRKAVPRPSPLPPEVKKALAEVEDPELRALIASVASRSLAR